MPKDLVELVVGGYFLTQDLEATCKRALHASSQELVDMEVFNTSARTPVLTGALLSDVQGQANTYGSDKLLAFIFSGTENQLDEYGRIYDLNQEGGALGLGSNNGSGNHQMYGKILTDDIPAIETWGVKACQDALDHCAAGTGVPRATSV